MKKDIDKYKLLTTKPKNSLKVKVGLNSVVSIIIEKIKLEITELDIDLIKKDVQILVYIMELVDEAIDNQEIIDKSTKANIDKNQLLTVIIKKLFPNITDEELSNLDPIIEFLLNNNLIEKKSVIKKAFNKFSKFFFIIKKPINFIKYITQNFICNIIQSQIPVVNSLPITNINQFTVYIILYKIGINAKIISLILLFL